MPHAYENPLTFRTLYDSPLVSVRDYHCRIGQGGPAGEEQPDSDQIVLMRQGTFRQHFGHRSVTADVNQAIFFAQQSTYRISHPAQCGDRGTTFTVAPRVLKDIIRVLDPTVDERSGRLFPFVNGPCEASIFWRHRELVQRLESAPAEQLEPLWADVTALQLVADVLEAAYARHGLSRKTTRDDTAADHAERVEAAKAYLASQLNERITLDDLARAVHTSPFHLARIFQQHTQIPIHRYLTRLRLRASLEHLAEGANDLTALALELGFASHSHFTGAFRREFGCAPSAARRRARQQTLRTMSKILEV
jgi:AraC family transcriptional regulator